MQIPPEKIEEIVERTDLVALISRHVDLKRSGQSFKGLCPFHGEKTPSFHVNPVRRYFKCFGCGAGGDAIAFLQRFSGRSFVEAVQDLAKDAGVTLEDRDDPAARERTRLLEANELARRHFEGRLWSSPAGQAGRDHLRERGVSEEIARAFNLGYALNSWNDLGDQLVREGTLEWGARAGLCAPRRQAGGYFDVFRGRLMIPIRSPEGRTVGFGARLVEDTARPNSDPGPKYLNSRESPLYRKGEILYGLDLAKEEIRRQRSAILVEGYFDVIGLYAAGVKNSVALCSTALTAGHLAALSRADAQELVLLLDGDAAGLKAVERLAGPILAAGVKARVATLPDGEDPDTFAQRHGKPGVEGLLAQAAPLSIHLLERALPRGKSSGFEEKMAAIARIRPILAQMPPGMAKTVFVSQLAEYLGVAESEVRAHLSLEAIKSSRPSAPKAPGVARAPALPLEPAEELFAALLMADPDLREQPEARFADEIRSLELRLVLAEEQPEQALATLPEAIRRSLERRLAEIDRTLGDPQGRRLALVQASRSLRLSRIEERLQEKKLELEKAVESSGLDDEVLRIQAEHRQLAELRMRLRDRTANARAPVPALAASKGNG
jgi:DNA primase